MNHSRTKSGFTLIELLLVIALLGILAATAIPKIFSGSEQKARENVRTAIVASVNTGLSLYAANQIAGGGNESYPATLDSQANGALSGVDNPFFINVLKGGVTSAGWTKTTSICYTYNLGASTETYKYDNAVGTYSKVASCP